MNTSGSMLIYDGTTSSISKMKGDGDFRGDESIAVLEQSDVVVTNPPFSLFREFIDQLVFYDKKFLILGHLMSCTYKDFFRLLHARHAVFGLTKKSGDTWFTSPYEEDLAPVPGIKWFTNLPVPVPAPLELTKKYNERDYPRYDNYEAIHVSRVKDIPRDYHGVMGVPVSFLQKWNPAPIHSSRIDERGGKKSRNSR